MIYDDDWSTQYNRPYTIQYILIHVYCTCTATSNINDYDEDTNDWEAFQDKDGNEYYYNHGTGESSWEYPW